MWLFNRFIVLNVVLHACVVAWVYLLMNVYKYYNNINHLKTNYSNPNQTLPFSENTLRC